MRQIRTLLLGLIMGSLVSGTAFAQSLTMATDSPGSVYNAIGSGMAKVVTDASPLRVIVRSFGGPDAYVDQLNNGELDLAAMSSSSSFLSYRGMNRAKKTFSNLRLLRSGQGGLFVGFAAMADSGIKTIADLKGKRVASDYGGHAIIGKGVTGALASAGLTWDDVKPVPVTGANDGIHALDAGRVDAAWASLGQPVVRELNANKAVRYISFGSGPESLKVLREKVFPGLKLATVKKNPDLGVQDDILMINYDTYVVCNADLRAENVKVILDALWNNTDQLTKIHPALKGFVNEAAVTEVPMVPYHPAAVAYYKEKGVWSEEAEMANSAYTK